MTEQRCDLARFSDFPCGGLIRTEWIAGRDIDQCEAHRHRMLQDIQDDYDKEVARD